MLEMSIETAQQFLINGLYEANEKGLINFSPDNKFADRGYDICFEKALSAYIKLVSPSKNEVLTDVYG